MDRIRAEHSQSITDFKKNPLGSLKKSNGKPIAVLKNNRPVAYFMNADFFERLLDYIDDKDLLRIAEERKGEELIEVDLNEL